MNDLVKKAIAEFLGTFALVVFGVGVAILTGNILATALAFGLVLLIMYYTIGRISGCHINPAVTIAMLIKKSIKVVPACVYIIVQILGAIAGAYFLQYAFKPLQNDIENKYNQYVTLYQFDQAKDYYISSYGYSEEQADLMLEKDEASLKATLKVNPDNFKSFGTNNVVNNTKNGLISTLIIEALLTFIFVLTVCQISSCSKYSRIGRSCCRRFTYTSSFIRNNAYRYFC